jgi:hypothetical protein
MMSRTVAWICILAAAFASVLPAQITGNVKGTVVDATQSSVASAQLTITSAETGESRQQTGDGEGRFAFNQLKIGTYTVKAEAPGFRTVETQAVVKAGETADVTFTLELGQITESISVNDVVSALDTTNAQVQQAIESRQVAEIPVLRDPLRFAATTAGVVPVNNNNTFLGQGSFNSNGGRGRGNNITVDNIIATDLSTTGNGGSQLGPLAFSQIAEVQVITNNFNAEYGRNSSAQLMFITKSGTNDFHGEVYDFLKNNDLNARAFFDRSGLADIVHQNQFGYALGGPIRKNKTHFFTTYEGTQLRGAGGTRIANVPTPAMLALVTDPTSQKVLDTYKLPAAQSIGPNNGQVQQSGSNFQKAFQVSFRVDQQFSEKDTLTARYGHYQSSSSSPGNTFISTNLANFGLGSVNGPREFSLSETHLFSPTVVNEFRAAYGRSSPTFGFVTTAPIGLPRFQFANNQVDQFGHYNGGPQGRVQNTYQYSDTISIVKRAHNIKAGVDVLRYQLNSFVDSTTRGFFLFDDWASFAAGQPTQYTQSFGSTLRGNRETNVFTFVQDDWKVTRKLTLNLGFRLEYAGPVSEVNGIISNLDPRCTDAMGAAGTGPLGCLTLHKPVGQANYNPGPRVGFAWNVAPKTVIRGGYGIAYDFNYLNPVGNIRTLPPFVQTLQITSKSSFTGANSYANLVAGTAALQTTTAALVGNFNPTQTNFGALGTVIDPHYKNPQAQQWSLGIEREVAQGVVLKASYVGTKTNYLQRTYPLNLINPALISPATSLADETSKLSTYLALNAQSTATPAGSSDRIDPRFNDVRLVDSGANSNYHGFEFNATKRFTSGYSVQGSYTLGKSIDDTSDALGVLINDSYVQQNPHDTRSNRGPSQFDIRQRAVITHVYELPFGKNTANPVVKRLIGGWGFSGITSFRTGFPVTFDGPARRGVSILTLTGTSTSPVRPNTSGAFTFNPMPAGSAGAPSGLTTDVAPISAYAASLGLSQPLIGNYGNLGRNVTRLNGQSTFDWSFYKNTAIKERFNLQFRAEMYNIFNTPTFQQVNRTITSPSFGQYTDTALDSRNMQMALRLVF